MPDEKGRRTIVITGGGAGIGYHAAVALAKSGAKVIISSRDPERGSAAAKRISEDSGADQQVDFVVGEVSSVAAVNALAQEILRKSSGNIDALVNNVGYLGDKLVYSADQIEMTFQVNVVAVYHLTHALLPALRTGSQLSGRFARVVNVSGGEAPAKVDPANLQAEKGFKGLLTYAHAKSCLESVSMILARELGEKENSDNSEKYDISVNVVFPGRASTAMTRTLHAGHLPGPLKCILPCFKCMVRDDNGKSAAKAAQSTIFACNSPELEGVTGKYFDTNCKEKALHSSAYSPDVQKKLLEVINGAIHKK